MAHVPTTAGPPTETDEQARERRICDFEKFATQLEGETFDEALAAAFYLAGMEAEAAHQKEKTDD